MTTVTTSGVLLATAPILVGIISWACYRRNQQPHPEVIDSCQPIAGVPGARILIMLSQIFVPLVTSLSLVTDRNWLLSLSFSWQIRGIGFVIAALGLGLFVVAKRQLGSNYSPCYDAVVPREIVRSGVYAFIRNPIYTANLTMICAAFLISGSLWVLAVFVSMVWLYRKTAIIEELSLTASLPVYFEYRAETGRFLPKARALRRI
ncbi:MAG: isoprenylcysteine carboxylmethyltransferase family protein [Proteobacteria bacterium]|nr:isoprenylcysteine carboxylmethyltransferase family protein [Pseudomonadota bacterium]